MDGLVTWFTETLGGIDPIWICFIISMVPFLELRGGLLAAALLQVDIFTAIPICIIGNILPIPFILWFITPIFNWLKKTKLFRPLVEKLENKAASKSDKIEKGYFWGLALFVGIPLPGTGAWTGSLIAAMLDIPKKKSIPAVVLGVCLAAALMGALSLVFEGLFF